MASDVVTRFRLETTQYDSALREAADGLKDIMQESRKAGKDFSALSDKSVEAARSLGQIGTTGNTAKEKVQDLVGTFNKLAREYNRMTDEQRKSDFGQAMGQSMQQLKDRIKEAKQEMQTMSAQTAATKQETGGLSGIVEDLAGKVGLSAKSFSLLGIAGAGVGAALKIAKDAFLDTEGGIDEWGRTLEGSKAIYATFLDTINGGNWSNFLTNLGEAVRGARDLYDALDLLGSTKANNNPAIAVLEEDLQRLRVMQQEGKDVSAQITAITQKIATLRKQQVDAGKAAGKQGIMATLRNTIHANGGVTDQKNLEAAAYDILHNGQQAFNKYARNVEVLRKKGTHSETLYNMDGTTGTAERFDINRLTPKERRQYHLSKAITDKETQLQQYSGIYADAAREGSSLYKQEYKGNTYALRNASGGDKTKVVETPKPVPEKMAELRGETKKADDQTRGLSITTSRGIAAWKQMQGEALSGMEYGSQERRDTMANMTDTTTFENLLNFADVHNINVPQEVKDTLAEKLMEGVDVKDEDFESLITSINEKLQETDIEPIKVNFETGGIDTVKKDAKDTTKAWSAAASAMSQVSGAMKSIEDPSVKIMGIIGEAIANVALAFAQASSKESKNGIWGWIAAVAAGTATMISTIASIRSATAGSYAQGGIIPGNSPTGDLLTANVNSGELILNRAQQDNLAVQLTESSAMGQNLVAEISGEKFLVMLDTVGRRKGKGRLTFSN